MTQSKGVSTLRHFRRRRADEGAAAVEFALLFPIFMILALGIINGGFAFSRQINVTQAAREASRYGATYDISRIDGLSNGNAGSGTFDQRAAIWIAALNSAAKTAVGNKLNPTGGYDELCVALVTYANNGTIDSAHSLYMQDDVLTPAATTGCPHLNTQPSFPGSSIVQVVLSRDMKFFVLFINPTIHLDAVSNTPYEGTAA